ncbi:hypothetical protein [Paenibacillus sp. y28]|uniref:hypothetical protein n=1 Tax=Paenibacillus sp. y28 TaxID=3129110 RepID=UPI00301988BE
MVQQSTKAAQHLFHVELLIEAETNGLAVEQLLHVLNRSGFKDFRVVSGITLGRTIEEALQVHPNSAPDTSKLIKIKEALKQSGTQPAKETTSTTKASNPKASGPASSTSSESASAAPQMKECAEEELPKFISRVIKEGTLVRLTVIKQNGVQLSLPCRILNFDTEMQNVSVYHVDEKNVYIFSLNEILSFD